MAAVGFEPTQLALVELESTPLDHSGTVLFVHAFVCLVCLFVRLAAFCDPFWDGLSHSLGFALCLDP